MIRNDPRCSLGSNVRLTRLRLEALTTENCSFSQGRKEMFYLTRHSTHFIYGYMASDIWLRTIPIVRKETHCCHIGYSFWLTARVLLCAPSHRQDITYHGLCYTSRGALAGTRNSSMGPPHEGSIRLFSQGIFDMECVFWFSDWLINRSGWDFSFIFLTINF